MKQKPTDGTRLLTALTSAHLAALVSVYLLYPGTGGYQAITVSKWNAYLLLTGGYVAVMLLLRLELAAVGAARLSGPRQLWQSWLPPQKLVFFYLCATALSAVCSDYRQVALRGGGRCEGLAAIALYCVSFLLQCAYLRPRRWMLWLFAAAISVNCVLCLFQFAGYNPLGLYPEGMNYYDANRQYAGEFLGTVGNADILSAVLSLSIPGLWAAFLRWEERRERFLLLVPLTLCLAVLFKAFVAGGVLGAGGAVLLSLPALRKSRAARLRTAAAAAVVLAVSVLAVYLVGDRMGGFLYEAFELLHGRWDDRFGSGRLYIWRSVVPLVPERPLLGGGPDTLGLRTDAAFERYDETLGILIHSSIDTAHNDYLNILVNQGIPALLLYLGALTASALRWLRNGAGDPAAAICGCAALGYCIQAFFGISSPISTPYLWLALAGIDRCITVPETRSGKKGGPHEKRL